MEGRLQRMSNTAAEPRRTRTETNATAARARRAADTAVLERERRKLLDLTFRNRLINFKPSKAMGAELAPGDPGRTLSRLLKEGRTCGLKAEDDEPDRTGRGSAVRTAHTRADLDKRLLKTWRHNRTAIEEQGVGLLHLAFGSLAWRESRDSEIVRRAPLILVPVELERTEGRRHYRIAAAGDGVAGNHSLRQKLTTDFGINLKDPPLGDDGVPDHRRYFDDVARLTAAEPGWKVYPEDGHLAFFAFAKIAMYEDLDPGRWSEGSGPADHPVLGRILDGTGLDGGAPVVRGDELLDEHPAASGIRPVADADGSQTRVLMEAAAGRPMTVQGPPGTGKSQTIVNLIGDAVAAGRTVLFVAEKRAAVDVVRRRLEAAGLGRACLAVDAGKGAKKETADELRRTLEAAAENAAAPEGHGGGTAGAERARLKELRGELNRYAAAVNRPIGKSGLTPMDVIGRLDAEGENADRRPLIKLPDTTDWTPERWAAAAAAARAYRDALEETPGGRDHAMRGTRLTDADGRTTARAAGAARALSEAVGRAQRAAEAVRRLIPGSDAPVGISQAWELAALGTFAAKHAGARGLQHDDPSWAKKAADWKAAAEAADAQADAITELDGAAAETAWTAVIDESAAAAALETLEQRTTLWGWIRRTRHRALTALAPLLRKPAGTRRDKADAEQAARVARTVLSWRRFLTGLATLNTDAGGGPAGPTPAPDAAGVRAYAERIKTALALHADIAANPRRRQVHEILKSRAAIGDPRFRTTMVTAAHAAKMAVDACEAAEKACGLTPGRDRPRLAARPFAAILEWTARAVEDAADLPAFARTNRLRARMAEAGVGGAADAADRNREVREHLTECLETTRLAALMHRALAERPEIARFDETMHRSAIDEHRRLDRREIAANRRRAAARHLAAVPDVNTRGLPGASLLKREIRKRSRHAPLRKLMTQAGTLMQAVKPVFMMSPSPWRSRFRPEARGSTW